MEKILLTIALILIQNFSPVFYDYLEKSAGVSIESLIYSEYQVTDIVDGDTIKVWIDGEEQTVRFVGIDTPETKHPQKGVECFGKEASNRTTELLYGQIIRLEPDTTQPDKDRYDRLLRYVITQDGTDINELLVEEGYARVYTKAGADIMERLLLLESIAKDDNRGLWGACS